MIIHNNTMGCRPDFRVAVGQCEIRCPCIHHAVFIKKLEQIEVSIWAIESKLIC